MAVIKAIPAIATAAAAPAVAASPGACTPSISFSGGLTYNWGTLNVAPTTQTLGIGGQTYVNNLPAGVTVTDISYQFWIENRQGQTTSGPGAYWMGNTTSNQKGYCASAGCTAPWTPTAGSGFRSTVTNTANLQAKVYPDGVTRQSWDLNMTWSSTIAPGTYTTSGTCQDFTTGPYGRFTDTYTGVTAMTTADKNAGKMVVNAYVIVTVKLSNGQTLTTTVQQKG